MFVHNKMKCHMALRKSIYVFKILELLEHYKIFFIINYLFILDVVVYETKFKWSYCSATLWKRHRKMLKRRGYLGFLL
jgi:hypothetical protein